MKIVVTHASPDWDAIGSVWLLKKYLSGWKDAAVKFVPAGERLGEKAKEPGERLANGEGQMANSSDAIEKIGEDEVIHVDTGLGPLDHHQTADKNVCGMSRTWDFVQEKLKDEGEKLTAEHTEAVSRIVKIVVDIDHFQEVFWADPTADYHEFSLIGLLDGLKYERPNDDNYYVEFGITCLNAELAAFENRIWAEKEIEKGQQFETRFGKAIGFETVNDTVLKLAQKMGFVLVVRKDPRKGYVRIKTKPTPSSPPATHGVALRAGQPSPFKGEGVKEKEVDLTLAYEQLRKIDPEATWFLHVSKKMLLNGTPKNPKMRPTKLSLNDIIKVLEKM